MIMQILILCLAMSLAFSKYAVTLMAFFVIPNVSTVHSVQTSLQSDVCRCMMPQGRLLSLPIRWPLSQQVPLLQKRRPLSQTYQLRRGCQRLNLQRRLRAPSETQMGHRQLRAMFRISIRQRCAVLQSCPLYIKLSALSEQCATFHVIEV